MERRRHDGDEPGYEPGRIASVPNEASGVSLWHHAGRDHGWDPEMSHHAQHSLSYHISPVT